MNSAFVGCGPLDDKYKYSYTWTMNLEDVAKKKPNSKR